MSGRHEHTTLSAHRHLSPHISAPPSIRGTFKRYRGATLAQIEEDISIVDLARQGLDDIPSSVSHVYDIEQTNLIAAHERLDVESHRAPAEYLKQPRPVYCLQKLPGLKIIPNLLSSDLQIKLLDRLLHRDLSNPNHKTNVHFHHTLNYPSCNSSFFGQDPASIVCEPLERCTLKPLTAQQFLSKRLRWFTLGGQYDWTRKCYPDTEAPAFPGDVKRVLQALVPDMQPEAAIVNIYSPGDTLSLHRDVAEECARPLLSASFGCDALFVVGGCPVSPKTSAGTIGEGDALVDEHVVLRLRSGDVVIMAGESRFAFHAIPKVIAGTCPTYLREWPYVAETRTGSDQEEIFRSFEGWMANKRVNLNVRQMYE